MIKVSAARSILRREVLTKAAQQSAQQPQGGFFSQLGKSWLKGFKGVGRSVNNAAKAVLPQSVYNTLSQPYRQAYSQIKQQGLGGYMMQPYRQAYSQIKQQGLGGYMANSFAGAASHARDLFSGPQGAGRTPSAGGPGMPPGQPQRPAGVTMQVR